MADREYMPGERGGRTHRFRITDRDGVVTAGYLRVNTYADGRVGEIFIVTGKAGEAQTWADQWAIAFSVCLQRGESLEKLCGKFVGARFEPSGSTTCKEIPRCTSLVDYWSRWLLLKFGKKDQPSVAAAVAPAEQSTARAAAAAQKVRPSRRHIASPDGVYCEDWQEGDSMAHAAMQSNCDECRGELGIGPRSQKGCGVKPLLDYVPEPWDCPGRNRD